MPTADDHSASEDRIHKIRSMVATDYDRISEAQDPFVILNLSSDAPLEKVRARYDRYEKFYRAENFQRFGDMDITRKALDIRRAIGRAMASIQSEAEADATDNGDRDSHQTPVLPAVDDDCAALGDIYFRDGLTYLKLHDLNAAAECLQRAIDYDPSRGIILAYLGYTRFKLRTTDPDEVQKSRKRIRRAVHMDPDNAEIYVLMARFGINTESVELAQEALDEIAELRPDHPKLDRLHQRLDNI